MTPDRSYFSAYMHAWAGSMFGGARIWKIYIFMSARKTTPRHQMAAGRLQARQTPPMSIHSVVVTPTMHGFDHSTGETWDVSSRVARRHPYSSKKDLCGMWWDFFLHICICFCTHTHECSGSLETLASEIQWWKSKTETQVVARKLRSWNYIKWSWRRPESCQPRMLIKIISHTLKSNFCCYDISKVSAFSICFWMLFNLSEARYLHLNSAKASVLKYQQELYRLGLKPNSSINMSRLKEKQRKRET